MFKKRSAFLLLMATLLATMCSCSAPEPIESTESLEPYTPIATATYTPAPTVKSYTTGKALTERTAYMPIGIMIENSPGARPQCGMQAADIVYEAPVEGCTRFFCIYSDTYPQRVGPVRSARIYFIQLQKEWDCTYIHFGGPQTGLASVYTSFASSIWLRIDFIKGKYNSYYWRDKTIAAPHNVFTDLQKCKTLVTKESKLHPLNFSDTLQYSGASISEVTLPFYTGAVTYKYDAENDVLVRYMNGKPFTDASTGEAITVKNLIVQYNRFYHGNEIKGRWLCDLLGSGKADFFIGGKHIKGTWKKSSYNSQTIYKDSDGNEIVLQPGNTWIAIHPSTKAITIK